MAKKKEIVIKRGSTFSAVVYWANGDNIVRKAITGISFATGAPVLEIAAHGIPNGWECAITLVNSPKQINAENSPPGEGDYHKIKIIDSSHIELNKVSPVDGSGRAWPAYTTGGFVQFYEPINLTGYVGRMDIKDKVGGTVLASSDADEGLKNIITITHDVAQCRSIVTISEAATSAIAWKNGVTDFEMVSPSGVVTKLKLTSSGDETDVDPVRVSGEVTTNS